MEKTTEIKYGTDNIKVSIAESVPKQHGTTFNDIKELVNTNKTKLKEGNALKFEFENKQIKLNFYRWVTNHYKELGIKVKSRGNFIYLVDGANK